MDKCQHNDKITKFCLSEICVWKEAGGCPNCIKKYHNHLGNPQFLDQKQIQNLLKKCKSDASVKPKVKIIEELIHNYFSNIKTELVAMIDQLDKKIRTDLCYPYLSKYSHLNVYKRLKKKQYKKVNQKQFRNFYEDINKISFSQLNKEQKNIYEELTKKYSQGFKHIFQFFNEIQSRSKLIQSPVYIRLDKNLQNKIRSILQTTQSKHSITNTTSTHVVQRHNTLNINVHNENLQEFLKRNQSSTTNDINTYNKKQQELSQMKKKLLGLMQKQINTKQKDRRQSYQIQKLQIRQQQKDKNQQIFYQIIEPSILNNQQQKHLHQKSDSTKKQSNLLNVQFNRQDNPSKNLIWATNQASQSKIDCRQDNLNHAFLPSRQIVSSRIQKRQTASESINRPRAIVIPIKGNKIEPDQNSPILRRKKQQEEKRMKQPFNINIISTNSQSQIKVQDIKLKQNEANSLALLNESLKSNSSDALKFARKSFQICTHNLSAAQYLSFLLLQNDSAVQALKVCNQVIKHLQGQLIYDINSLHIHNNKAVALMMLGRYSESITELEKCIQVKEQDRFYKNLGDAYSCIGIYQKAVFYYEKCILMNPSNGQAHYNLAVSLYQQQSFHNALLNIQKAQKISPERKDYEDLEREIKQRL